MAMAFQFKSQKQKFKIGVFREDSLLTFEFLLSTHPIVCNTAISLYLWLS